jgi:hypothetical protein
MLRNKRMSWYYTCNNKKFINKLEVLREYNKSKQAIHFHIPEAYDDYDFTTPPMESLEELCKQKAVRLRESNDKIVIWYSGGCDSHYILNIFLKNNIKVDKLIMIKSGFEQADFEIDQYAIPFAKSTGIKFAVRQPDMEYYKDYYINGKKMLGTAHSMWHHFRLNNHFENLEQCETNSVANIFGKEKPKLCFVNGKWYTYFLDVEVTNQPHQTNFFCDDPEIYSAQCHALINQTQMMKNQSDYNLITHYDEHQDFWNRAIGRYTENNFPLKELSIGDNFNNKDQIALAHADQELIHKWKERNSSLVDEIGEEHFNAGNPALGTVGVFSKFYCITEKSIKTVDELFSNGFKL